MSSFVVGNETIDRILSGLPEFQSSSSDERTRIGRNMLEINLDATEQQLVGGKAIPDEERKARLEAYSFHERAVTKAQALKSLQCWLYQAYEGDVIKRGELRWWEKQETKLLQEIVESLPEYTKAEWG